ncbi:phage tail protein [Aeromonas hydrophila]|uniref:Phage tail protein n=1 Tax=Aeromonas hydrophila TaxID=644 RepID=A0AAX3P9C3_AERHY|nr:phage tail protein [Aeromonas hydrophila]WEE26735.1 phage tail protein [Aeromonas hydrophila]
MSQVITNAFENYWQSCLTAEQPVVLDEFILADIPNLDITSPIDPETGLPPESQIVHRQNVDQRGRINNNAVAYTIVMDTTVGDFSFNAMYLRNKQNGVIGMIVYKGRETKLKTDQTTGQTGNSLVKSMLMGYDQAAEATLTHVDAGTWQIDYAARLRGMDEDIRQLQADLYGHHTFVGDGFKVVEKDGAYQVSQGVAIIGGLRVELKAPEVIHPGIKPIGVWVDVHRAGSLLSEHQNHFTIITSVADLTDHVDSNGYQHYVAKLGTLLADNEVVDNRSPGGNSGTGKIPDTFSIWKRSMAEAGLNLVDGNFQQGGTVTSHIDVLLDADAGVAYAWEGELPKTVLKGSTPASTGGILPGRWQEKNTVLLRNLVTKQIETSKFASVADMVADTSLELGDKVQWLGYYEALDGGGNIGIVTTVEGYEDGGSKFYLANGLQVVSDTRQINFKHFGGRSGLGITGNSERLEAYKAFVEANPSRGYTFDVNNGEVYRLTRTHDFNGRPVRGLGFSGGCSKYQFKEQELKSCIYLDGMVVEAYNVTRAKNIGFVSNRNIQTGSTVYHTKRLGVYFDNVELWHGFYNLRCPFGAIPIKIHGGTIERAARDNIFVQDQDDGMNNPDLDTNIVLLDAAHVAYAARHNVNLECRGGIYKITNGSDISKAGEPAGLKENNVIDMYAFGVRIVSKSGVIQGIEIDNAWMEKNANMIQLVGVMRNISINNIRCSAFDDSHKGKMIELNGYIYDLDIRRISGSGPKYAVAVDVEKLSFDQSTGITNINNINIEKSVSWADKILDTSTANGTRFAREHGGFVIQLYPSGSCIGLGAQGSGGYYTLKDINGLTPVVLQPSWYFNSGQASDVSLYVGGVYAGEIINASASSFTTNKLISGIGNGSIELYVKKKHYGEISKPASFYQGVNFV